MSSPGARPPDPGAGALESAPPAALADALFLAAEGGGTALSESLLGALLAQAGAPAAARGAAEALAAAAAGGRWATARYLADYLDQADPPPPPSPRLSAEVAAVLGQSPGGGAPSGPVMGGAPARVTFSHVEPGRPSEAFGGAERPSPYFSLAAPARSLRALEGADEPVLPGPDLEVLLASPPLPFGESPRRVTLRAPPGRDYFTRGDVGRAVAEAYGGLAASAAPGSEEWSHSLAEIDLVAVHPLEGEPGVYGLDLALG